MVETKAAHAERILRLRAARNTNPARCRGAGRDGWMVLPGTLLAGAGLMTANATPTTRGRSKRRPAVREELQEWRAAETRRGPKPASWRNEARMPTGQVLQFSCGVTPNVMSEPNGAKLCAIWGLTPTRVGVLRRLTPNSGRMFCANEQPWTSPGISSPRSRTPLRLTRLSLHNHSAK